MREMNKSHLKFDPSMFGPFIKKKIIITRTLLVTLKDLTVRVIRTAKIDDFYFGEPEMLCKVVKEFIGRDVLRVEQIEIEDC